MRSRTSALTINFQQSQVTISSIALLCLGPLRIIERSGTESANSRFLARLHCNRQSPFQIVLRQRYLCPQNVG